MSSLSPGSVLFDRFTLERPLGAGGAAAVWLADDSGTKVAVKILHAERRRSAPALERFRREADILRSLDHPRIARLIDLFADGDLVYFAMAYVDGRTLEHELGRRSTEQRHFADRDALSIFRCVADAIAFAHSRGVLHRDIKPQNIMISGDDGGLSATVVDFGIAKLLDGNFFDATTRGRRIGSILYSAPEQQIGDEIDERADLFALGSVLFEVLTLTRAWARGPNDAMVPAFSDRVDPTLNALPMVIERLAKAERPKVSAARSDLPEEIDAVLSRAMASDKGARHASVQAFVLEVEGLLSARATRILDAPEESKTKTEEVVRPTKLVPRRARRTALPLVVASLLAALLYIATREGEVPVSPSQPPPVASTVRVEPREPPPEQRPPDPIEDEASPPASPPARGPNSSTRLKRTTVVAKAPPVRTEGRLRVLLANLERRPNDPDALAELREAIRDEARTIKDEKTRSAIERITASSALTGDVRGLAVAVQRIEDARRR